MKRHQIRRKLYRWLASFFRRSKNRRPSNLLPGLSRRAIRLEPLEARQLMASDAFMALLGSSYSIRTVSYDDALPAMASSQAGDVAGAPTSSLQFTSNNSSEGEDAPESEAGPDLVAFAKALAASGTVMYGADWCPFCAEQKRLFEDGAMHLGYVDVTNPDRTPNEIAADKNITSYPTWIFPDNSRLVGVQTLETLAERAGISIPQSNLPHVESIANVSVGIGSPLHVPVDAYHPGGNPLTITVTSDNPNLINASVLSGNRSMLIQTNFGDMTFQLFEDKAPRATQRVIELVQDGFYNDLLFHRVIDGFMIQGGDPNGNGTGGSDLGNFDDQFHVDLQHNRSGVLSFAKSSDDTNNSQFFITETATRHLDFNHSVFGQLVEGDWARNNISETATNSSDKPINDVAMRSVTIFTDTENGLLFLEPTGNGTGTANITVTVSDGTNSTTTTFAATVTQDASNGAPFLDDIPVLQATAGVPLNYTLTSQDAENDPVVYSVEAVGSVSYQLSVNSATGVVTLTPPANFTGQLQFRARVRQDPSVPTNTQDVYDSQLVTVQVSSAVTLGLSLVSSSDTGSSNSDGVTNASSLTFNVTGTTVGGTIEILAGDQVVGTATANSATTQVTVQNASALAEGTIAFTARQRVNGNVNANSTALQIRLDRTVPASLLASSVPTSTIVDEALSIDLNHAEEGQGLTYALLNAPSGMTIGATNGQISWTPGQSQLGPQSFTVVLTDLAGNERQQTFSLNVIQEPLLGFRLATVSTTGSPITSIAVGQQFKVQVYVDDLRAGSAANGVYTAGLNLAFNSAVIQPIATSPITHVSPYTEGRTGTVTDSAIVGLGGVSSSTSPLGGDERLLVEVTFVAIAAGDAGLIGQASTDTEVDLGLYGDNNLVPADRVQYGSSSFVVGLNYQLVNDVYNFDEDSGSHTLNVLSNDVPETGVSLTIVEVSTPSGGGSVSIATGGQTLLYTPAANFHGAETLTYTVENGQGVRQTATVTLQITEVNDPPVAVNDSLDVIQNSSVNILDVLANDTRGADDGVVESLTVTQVTQGSAGGVVEVGTSGLNVRYTPVSGFTGTDTFTYTISDGRGGTSTATVTVTVRPAVPPPTVVNDSYTLDEDSASANYSVLSNDTPQAGTTLAITNASSSSNGSTIGITSNQQQLIYKPGPNFAGTEVITYTVTASDGGIATGQVTFTVNNLPDVPVAVNDTKTVNSSVTSSVIDVLANDSDPDPGETATLTITAVTQPAAGQGTVAISANGKQIIYTAPSTTYEGSASFTYTISDTTGRTATASVQLTVHAYSPRAISGNLVFANGVTSSAYVLAAIPITLTGTDSTGTSVNKTAHVDSTGAFEFEDLAPGQYVLSRPALPFMNDDGQQLSIVSEPQDGDFVAELIVDGGLRSNYIDIRDFLGSSYRKTLTAVVNSNGTAQWVSPAGSWANFSNFSFQISSTGVTITANNGASGQVSSTVPLTDSRLTISTEGTNRMIKLRGEPSEFNFAAPTTTT